jgi:hypothetical protein
VADRVVDRRTRPIIDTAKLGEETEPGGIHRSAGRPGGDAGNDRCLGRHDERPWHGYEAEAAPLHRPGRQHRHSRRTRIVAGPLGDVRFTSQHGRQVIFIRVTKNQGKHPKPRSVVARGQPPDPGPPPARQPHRVPPFAGRDGHGLPVRMAEQQLPVFPRRAG